MSKISDVDSKFSFLFGKKNYLFMILGLTVILLGFLLMTGPEANTVNGVRDVNQWNPDIYSWRRTRLAPFVVLLGFAIEIYAIMFNPHKPKAK
ncbi:MAG: DUF3098 domain-containing protein [Weeksellaceae bacterium]